MREAGRFAINLLASGQEDLAGVFASKLPESEKLEGVAHRYEDGVPVIEGSLAWAVCALQELIAGGDHTIAIGQVTAMGLGSGEPLLWYAGRYHGLPGAERLTPPASGATPVSGAPLSARRSPRGPAARPSRSPPAPSRRARAGRS